MPERDAEGNYDPQREAEGAAEADKNAQSDNTAPKHDPYAHLRPYMYKKGKKNGACGKPRKRKSQRSFSSRVKAAGTLKVANLGPVDEIARKFGLSKEEIERMDLLDVLAMSMILNAIRGKGPAMEQVIKNLGFNSNQWAKADYDLRNMDRGDYADRATRFYSNVMDDESATMDQKLKARAQLDRIEGLVVDNDTMGAEEAANKIRDFVLKAADAKPAVQPSKSKDSNPLP